MRGLQWVGYYLRWGVEHVGAIEPRPDGTCIAIVHRISPHVEPMRIERPSKAEARAWVETQTKTLLVLEGHDVEGPLA